MVINMLIGLYVRTTGDAWVVGDHLFSQMGEERGGPNQCCGVSMCSRL